MRSVYILLVVLVIAASALGCVGKKQGEGETTKIPVSPGETSTSPTETVSPPASPAGTPSAINEDPFGTEGDINAIDSIVNDSAMDISLSDTVI